MTSGGGATYNHVLKVGTIVLEGTMKDRNGNRMQGWIGALDPVTGHYAAQAHMREDQPFQLRLLVAQPVRLRAEAYWFNGTFVGDAEPRHLNPGRNVVSLCATATTTMRICRRIIPVPTLSPRWPVG